MAARRENRIYVLKSGAPFLFRLKSPINRIAGLGFFSLHSLMQIGFAWEVFQHRNGVGSLIDFHGKINSLRRSDISLESHPTIGYVILSNPVFFNEPDWLPVPGDWPLNVIQGKRYDSSMGYGRLIWEKIEFLLHKYRLLDSPKENNSQLILEECNMNDRYGSEILTRVRLGQGAYRIMITEA